MDGQSLIKLEALSRVDAKKHLSVAFSYILCLLVVTGGIVVRKVEEEDEEKDR